jgi:Amt family ammonium transporter
VSVHLVCGVFGTLALGLFAQEHFTPNTTGNGLFFGGGLKLFMAQLIGVVVVGIFSFGLSMVAWGAIKAAVGIRVSPEEEYEGLDIGEHGISAYPEFHTGSGAGGAPVGMGRTASMMSTEAVAERG